MKKLLIFHFCKSTDMEMSTMQHWCYGKELRCNSWGLILMNIFRMQRNQLQGSGTENGYAVPPDISGGNTRNERSGRFMCGRI